MKRDHTQHADVGEANPDYCIEYLVNSYTPRLPTNTYKKLIVENNCFMVFVGQTNQLCS